MTEAPRGTEPESDDSQNPTTAAPATADNESAAAADYAGDSTYAGGTDSVGTSMSADPSGEDEPWSQGGSRRRGVQFGGAERFGQVQTIIEDLAQQARPVARQAVPVLREIAAKAAEIAAIAAEHAGPLARRAAEVTQDVGVRVAARSREVASDLRRTEDQGSTSEITGSAAGGGAEPGDSSMSSRSREGTQRPPTTPGL